MITPLVEAVNQTVSQAEVSNFGDLAIQLRSVEPINGEAQRNRFFVVCVKNIAFDSQFLSCGRELGVK